MGIDRRCNDKTHVKLRCSIRSYIMKIAMNENFNEKYDVLASIVHQETTFADKTNEIYVYGIFNFRANNLSR